MTARPKPPVEFDDNPPLDPTFFERAKPAVLGTNDRLKKALEQIIKAHETGAEMDDVIADAKSALMAAQ